MSDAIDRKADEMDMEASDDAALEEARRVNSGLVAYIENLIVKQDARLQTVYDHIDSKFKHIDENPYWKERRLLLKGAARAIYRRAGKTRPLTLRKP